jgi:hypothetical protein
LNGKNEGIQKMQKSKIRAKRDFLELICFFVAGRLLASVANSAKRSAKSMIDRSLVAIARYLRNIVGMIRTKPSDELLCYVPKRDKLIEGGLLLLERAAQGGQSLTNLQLVTTMFLADKAHLDAYGRPVFFDNYVAAKDGPEGVAATEMLDPQYDWASIGVEVAPWTCQVVGELNYSSPSRPANLRRLSETDIEALESALAMVVNLGPDQLHLFTHRSEAYVAAWNDGIGEGSKLDPRLIPDTRDDEMIEDLLYASRHAFIAPRR